MRAWCARLLPSDHDVREVVRSEYGIFLLSLCYTAMSYRGNVVYSTTVAYVGRWACYTRISLVGLMATRNPAGACAKVQRALAPIFSIYSGPSARADTLQHTRSLSRGLMPC